MISTSEKIVFHVSTRERTGTSGASQVRREGKVPGNIYGLGEDSLSVMTPYHELRRLYENQGETGLIYLQIDDSKKQVPVLIDELTREKIGSNILHVSFKRVNLNVKIEAEIEVVTVGEVHIDDAIVSVVESKVSIKALPADLPDHFEVDISGLTEVGQSISLADLVYDKSKIDLVLDENQSPEDVMLVNVQEIKEEVEPEPVEVEGEGEGEEGGATTDETIESGESTDGGDEGASQEESEDSKEDKE